MSYGLPLFLAFLVVLCVPSSNLQLFDGLPFSRLPEFAALAATLPFLIFPALRQAQADFLSRLKIRTVHLWIFLAALFLLKVALFASGARAGFAGCYGSPAEPTYITYESLPARPCERSYENLFDRYGATRLDRVLWFGPDSWDLVFLNHDRYNYYDWEEGIILRPRIPIEAHWSGYPDVGAGESIRIEYVGEGSVAWGDLRVSLPPAYGEPGIVELGPPGTASSLRIDYLFDDGSRSGQDSQSWGPRATFKASSGKDDARIPLAAQSPAVGWRILARIADGLVLLWLVSFLPALWVSVRVDLPVLIAFAAGIGLISLAPIAPVFREVGMTCVLAAVLTVHLAFRPLRAVSAYFIVVAAGFAVTRIWYPDLTRVVLRTGGNDPLQLESLAYSILYNKSLQGGEAVFFRQPMFRYVLFASHALFGDGNPLFSSVHLSVFFGSVFFLFSKARAAGRKAWRRIAMLPAGLALIFLGGYFVSNFIRSGLSEYASWNLFLLAFPLLFLSVSSSSFILGAAALALSFTVRFNQLPAVLWMLLIAGVWQWKRDRKAVVWGCILAAGIALLPLAHNLYFGGVFEPTTINASMPANLSLPPSTWLAFLQGDPSAAAAVREQMAMMFLIADVPRDMLPTLAAMGVCLVAWLSSVLYAVVRGLRRLWPLLAVPSAYLAPHVFYVVNNYYPRHIVIAYLSMALIPVAVLALESPEPSKKEPVSSAVESPRR
jgi:hypothetical protein